MAHTRRNRRSLLRMLYALCLLGATVSHALSLYRHGLLYDYGGVPLPSAVFWTGLTFADPITAILLFARPKAELALTVLIIIVDVLHNSVITAIYATGRAHLRLAQYWPLASQIAFLVFVLLTVRRAWEAAGGDDRPAVAA